jgi:hypothetical protein
MRDDRSTSTVYPKLTVIGPSGVRAAFIARAEQERWTTEAQAREILGAWTDAYSPSLIVMYDGNTVWRREPLVKNVQSIVKAGDMSKMSDYLYQFVSLVCGSIAHYNKAGWIAQYPTVQMFRRFFLVNEFGRCVLDHIPHWYFDARSIAGDIMSVLGED